MGLSTQKIINERTSRWANGKGGTLWNKAILSKAAKKARETSSQNENKMLESAKTICHQGLFGKAAKLLNSDGLAHSNEKTYEDLCSLHLKQKEPILPVTDELCLAYQFSEEQRKLSVTCYLPSPKVLQPVQAWCILSINQTSFVAITLSSPESQCKNTNLIIFCSASGFPNDVGPTFCNASLTAFKKRKTGARPIAVGEVFSRIVAKGLVSFAKEEALDSFCPQSTWSCHKGRRRIYYPRQKTTIWRM